MSQYSDIEHTDIMLILVQSKLYHELELSRTNSKLSTELMLYHMQVRYHWVFMAHRTVLDIGIEYLLEKTEFLLSYEIYPPAQCFWWSVLFQ